MRSRFALFCTRITLRTHGHVPLTALRSPRFNVIWSLFSKNMYHAHIGRTNISCSVLLCQHVCLSSACRTLQQYTEDGVLIWCILVLGWCDIAMYCLFLSIYILISPPDAPAWNMEEWYIFTSWGMSRLRSMRSCVMCHIILTYNVYVMFEVEPMWWSGKHKSIMIEKENVVAGRLKTSEAEANANFAWLAVLIQDVYCYV